MPQSRFAATRRNVLVALAGLGLGTAALPAARPAAAKKKKPKCTVKPTDDLQTAIDNAADGATLRLCKGTFPSNLKVSRNLTIVGAGTAATVLDGGGVSPVLAVRSGAVVSVQGATLTNGFHGTESGGGVVVSDASTLTLTKCVVSNCLAGFGGGIYVDSGLVTLDGTKVTGNRAVLSGNPSAGGGVYVLNGTLNVVNGSVIGGKKTADANQAWMGAGLYTYGTATFAKGTKVTGNLGLVNSTLAPDGGGIYKADGTVTLATAGIVVGNDPNQCAGQGDPIANCVN